MKVAVLGASSKPDRYSYKAVMLLKELGHSPLPVNPALDAVDGIPAFASLLMVPAPIDIVTVYLGPANQKKVAGEIIERRPRRVIFNPGAENPPLAERLRQEGIETMDACTLVLLKTGQFNI